MQILPGVFKFDTGPFNWYIIEEAGRITLIDAGFPGHYATFKAGLQEMGKSIEDVDAILLTHAHADHTGFAERLRRESNATVHIHRDDQAGVSRPLNLPWFGLLANAWRSYTRSMLLHATWNGIFQLPAISKVRAFEHGDILEVPGRPQVLHVPGHTPGEVCFFFPERQLTFSGDTIVTRNLFTGAEDGPQIPHRLLNSSDRQARQSLDLLKDLGYVTILPGHGKPWTGEITVAIELANKRVN